MISNIKLVMNFITNMEPITMLFLLAMTALGIIGVSLFVVLTALRKRGSGA